MAAQYLKKGPGLLTPKNARGQIGAMRRDKCLARVVGSFPVAGGCVLQGCLQFGKLGFSGIMVFPIGKIEDVMGANFPGQILAGVGKGSEQFGWRWF